MTKTTPPSLPHLSHSKQFYYKMASQLVGIPILIVGLIFLAIGLMKPKPETSVCVKLLLGKVEMLWGENKYNAIILFGVLMCGFSVGFRGWFLQGFYSAPPSSHQKC